MTAASETTHFGFETVPLREKQAKVDDVFHKVAGRYDLMNDLMSAGLHRAWKSALLTAVNPPKDRPFRHLDVAGGTGDVAFSVLEAGGPQTDVTVLDMETDPVQRDRGLIEAALFDSGRPVLIVPPGRERYVGKRILIAWDGGASAARAVADALPFLKQAEEVEILTVTGEKDLAGLLPGTDLAPHLARHGVKVTVRNVALGEADVASEIRQAASGFAADLIVCGAYKHSRLREWLLGGVTQSLLQECRLPILMSH